MHHTKHQIKQHHHHRNEAFMCQCNQVFLCARFNPPLRIKQPASREQVENVFNTYKSIQIGLTPCCALCSLFSTTVKPALNGPFIKRNLS